MIKFFANQKTGVIHSSKVNDRCRGWDTKAVNRLTVDTDAKFAQLINAAYRKCKLCFPKSSSESKELT